VFKLKLQLLRVLCTAGLTFDDVDLQVIRHTTMMLIASAANGRDEWHITAKQGTRRRQSCEVKLTTKAAHVQEDNAPGGYSCRRSCFVVVFGKVVAVRRK
jgi:hypothetical protein